jgi:peptide/nickel transport system substrate-binding protein
MRSRLALALFVLAFACWRGERAVPPSATTPAVADDTTPQEGGTLVRRLEAQVDTLNPVLAKSRYGRMVDNYIFTPLLYLDSNLKVAPGLAKSWDMASDGRSCTFHLDEKATFSDGTPVLASDVLWTLQKILDPATGAEQISGFETVDLAQTRVVDPLTIFIAFKEPLSSQLTRFYDLNVLPQHVYSKGNFANDYTVKPVGSGPYRLVAVGTNNDILLERREDFRGQKPYLKRVIFKTVLDVTTAWNALKHGDIDETNISSDVWQNESRRPELQRIAEFRRFYTLNFNAIAWNLHNPLFADKRVRRALGMCLDLGSIINNLYHGTARALTGPFTPDQYAYNPAVPVLPYDPIAARELLRNAGWTDTNNDGVLDKGGKPFKFDLYVFTGTITGAAIGQIFQQELKKIGVEVNVVQLDPALMIKRTFDGQYDASYMGWQLDAEPDLYNLFHSSEAPPKGQNIVFYNNPEADRLIDAARRELDISKRQKLLQQLHALLAEDQPYTWTIQVSEKWAINRRVHNVKESRGYGLFAWYPGEFDWWIPRDQRTHDRDIVTPAK